MSIEMKHFRWSCAKIFYMSTRIVFMGSPDFSLPALRELARNYPVVGVITQPDRPAGRGMVLTPPPVKVLANEFGLPVIQPEKIRQPEALQQLRDWQPDVIVVAAFGQILRQNVLDLPPHGCINIHGSLLPRWRGASPVQAALLNGDESTGVSIMRLDAGMDTGPILAKSEIQILPEDTTGTLMNKLAELGASVLLDILPRYLQGDVHPQLQDNSLATKALMIRKEDGQLDFTFSAVVLARRVRAFQPWPGTFMLWKGQPLKIHAAHSSSGAGRMVGELAVIESKPAVACGQDWLVLDEVQPAGKRSMPGRDFLRGVRDWGNQPN